MNTTTSQTSLELVERYLQAVRFWLPKKAKQDDLLAELGEDLRSQMEAKEEELGRPLEKNEAAEILKACGDPMVVAGRVGPQRYLIGPTLFPIYLFVLKMVVVSILVPVFLFILGPINFANSGGDWGKAILATLGGLWTGGFIAAGVITLVFAVLEATHAFAGKHCKWDPASLPPLEKPERKTSFAQTASELVFNVFGLVWLLLIPQHPFMILGPAANVLKPAPLWHTFYLPIVLLAALAIVRLAIVLARPRWTHWPKASQIVQSIFVLVLLRYILEAATHVPATNWYPFVMLADSVKDSAQYIKIAAIVNVSILIALAATWLGVSIGIVAHTWELLQQVRKERSGIGPAAALHLR